VLLLAINSGIIEASVLGDAMPWNKLTSGYRQVPLLEDGVVPDRVPLFDAALPPKMEVLQSGALPRNGFSMLVRELLLNRLPLLEEGKLLNGVPMPLEEFPANRALLAHQAWSGLPLHGVPLLLLAFGGGPTKPLLIGEMVSNGGPL
jgi:hypothetical protein